jgi:uncharacterized DUF497 family protein
MKFEWDRKKEKSNIEKHGVSFEQASYVFADPFALNKYDDEHSQEEDRWVLLGKSLYLLHKWNYLIKLVYEIRNSTEPQ